VKLALAALLAWLLVSVLSGVVLAALLRDRGRARVPVRQPRQPWAPTRVVVPEGRAHRLALHRLPRQR